MCCSQVDKAQWQHTARLLDEERGLHVCAKLLQCFLLPCLQVQTWVSKHIYICIFKEHCTPPVFILLEKLSVGGAPPHERLPQSRLPVLYLCTIYADYCALKNKKIFFLMYGSLSRVSFISSMT